MQARLVVSVALGIVSCCAAGIASAADIGVVGRALVIEDRFLVGRSKLTFVTRDAAVDKGTGTDAASIGAELQVSYDATAGTFLMPQSTHWLVNKSTLAVYANPQGPDSVSYSRVKPGRIVKVKTRSLGDTPMDISTAPTGPVLVVHRITNGLETVRHCTHFNSCEHKVSPGSFRLVCRRGSTPAACPAGSPSGAFVN